jgi:phosphate:Na+ symporter
MQQFLVLLGGLGVFLYGMQLLSESLVQLTTHHTELPSQGGFLRRILQGIGITAVVQSSGVVTLVALSAADAGALSVWDAIGLCWGANLGTTATGHLLRLVQHGATQAGGIGVALCCFCGMVLQQHTTGRAAAWGRTLLGFGLLFTGLNSAQSAVLPLLNGGRLGALFAAAQKNFLFAFLLGVLLATALQSSSAAVGLLQITARSGLLCYGTALPLIMGVNVGTCSTALLACLGASKNRRAAMQVALGHLTFNLFGCGAAVLGYLLSYHAELWQMPVNFASLAWLQTIFNAATLCLLLISITLLRKIHAKSLCAS